MSNRLFHAKQFGSRNKERDLTINLIERPAPSAPPTLDASKTKRRLFLDKFLTLIVVSLPIAMFAIWGNSELAKYNANLKEREYQRATWERLDRNLSIVANDYFSRYADIPRYKSKEDFVWTPPTVSERSRLLHSIAAIRRYADSLDYSNIVSHCDRCVADINIIEHSRSVYMNVIPIRAIDPATNKPYQERRYTKEDMDIMLSVTGNIRPDEYFNSTVPHQFDILVESINNLSLTILDPSYMSDEPLDAEP